MKRLRSFVPGVGVCCLALLVRLIYNNTVARAYYPLHDSLAYQSIGLNILREHCFCQYPHIATVYRAPLWPAIIAAIALFFGPSDYFARLFLCCVGSATCLLVYLLAKNVFDWRIGVVAGVAAAIYPELYIYDGWLYTESLYTFLLLAFCYGVYQLQRSPQRNKWLWCGVLLGLLSLTRPNGLLVLGPFILWAITMGWIKVLSWSTVTKSVVTITLIALALIAPWTIRNYTVSHTFIPVATGDGTVLLGAYNSQALTSPSYPGGHPGTWINPLLSSPTITRPYPLSTCAASCEVAREEAYERSAQQWIQAHLAIMPHLLALHFINMWQPDTYEADLPTVRFSDQRSTQLVLGMMKSFPIFIFILTAFGFLATLRHWRQLLFIYFMMLLTMAECVIFYGVPRFRAPIEPMLILLAAGAIWWICGRRRKTNVVVETSKPGGTGNSVQDAHTSSEIEVMVEPH